MHGPPLPRDTCPGGSDPASRPTQPQHKGPDGRVGHTPFPFGPEVVFPENTLDVRGDPSYEGPLPDRGAYSESLKIPTVSPLPRRTPAGVARGVLRSTTPGRCLDGLNPSRRF